MRFKLLVSVGILVLLSVAGCIRLSVDQAMLDISVEQAPYVVEFRNSGWIDGAIMMENYHIVGSYLEITNYYDRHGYHNGNKYIPLRWVIRIYDRRDQ